MFNKLHHCNVAKEVSSRENSRCKTSDLSLVLRLMH